MHYCKWVKRTLHASCCVFRNKVFYFRVNLRICFVLLRKSQCFVNGKYTQKSRFHGKGVFTCNVFLFFIFFMRVYVALWYLVLLNFGSRRTRPTNWIFRIYGVYKLEFECSGRVYLARNNLRSIQKSLRNVKCVPRK